MNEIIGTILLIVTSHAQMESGKPTGLWLEEFTVPYEVFTEAGYEVVVASPRGGKAPVDPRSLPENPDPEEQRKLDLLTDTVALDSLPRKEFDGIFFSGGHGTMFDFPTDPHVQKLVSEALAQEQPLALVCHGPAALVGVSSGKGSAPLAGRTVTGFTNQEEEAVHLVEEVPFLLETRLRELGAEFIGGSTFQEHVVVDRNLVTGQNPASSRKTAEKLLERIESD